MSFTSTDLYVRMPFIGLISRNTTNFEPAGPGWMSAEYKLCGEYKQHITQVTESKFNQSIEYMSACHDLGRTPLGFGTKLFLFMLIAAEAMGFSYLLGTWIARDASANTYTYLMYGIVFVLASILAILTHYAGEQFYATKLKRACYDVYKKSGDKREHATKPISLNSDQFADADDLPARRCLNRIVENGRDTGSYSLSWATAIFVALIFSGSAYMRVKHMQTELTEESAALEQTTSNPFAAPIAGPKELVAIQKESDDQTKKEIRANTEGEGIAAILILSVIFGFTQFVGFMAGKKHCFAGKETYKTASGNNSAWLWSRKDGAFANTGGYSVYDTYWEMMEPIKAIVNTRLKDLQHRLMENSPKNLDLTKTFEDFLQEREAGARIGRERHNTQSHPSVPTVSPLDQAKATIGSIDDRMQQQEYFKSLPTEVREALKPWLAERKKNAAQISQAELDNLF